MRHRDAKRGPPTYPMDSVREAWLCRCVAREGAESSSGRLLARATLHRLYGRVAEQRGVMTPAQIRAAVVLEEIAQGASRRLRAARR